MCLNSKFAYDDCFCILLVKYAHANINIMQVRIMKREKVKKKTAFTNVSPKIGNAFI